jgi:hypothetical protein
MQPASVSGLTGVMIYAIRRKGTHDYLPSRRDGKVVTRYGFTGDEPILFGGEYGPRLFFKEVSARRALAAWLAGVWKAKRSSSGGIDHLFEAEYEVVIDTQPPPQPRRREDMEIVPFDLSEVSSQVIGWVGKQETLGSYIKGTKTCATCSRDTAAAGFDGCMLNPCPFGYEPCL